MKALVVLTLVFAPVSYAQSQLAELERNTIVRRASEAAIWGMPAVAVYDILLAMQRNAGAAPGVVAIRSSPMHFHRGFLTANDVAPYAISGLTTKDGPIRIEIPPAARRRRLFGPLVNAWQVPIVDV